MKRLLYSVVLFSFCVFAQPPLPFDAEKVPAITGNGAVELFFRTARFFTFGNHCVQVVKRKHLNDYAQRIQSYEDLKESLQYGFFRLTYTENNEPYVVYHPRMAGGGFITTPLFKFLGGLAGGYVAKTLTEQALEFAALKIGDAFGIKPEDVHPVFHYLYVGGKTLFTVYDMASLTKNLAKVEFSHLTTFGMQQSYNLHRDFDAVMANSVSTEDAARNVLELLRNYARTSPELAANILGSPTAQYIDHVIDALAATVPQDPEAAMRLIQNTKAALTVTAGTAYLAYESLVPSTPKEALSISSYNPDELSRTLSSVQGGMVEKKVDDVIFNVVKTGNPHVKYGVCFGNPSKQALFVKVDGIEIPIPIDNKIDFTKPGVTASFGGKIDEVLQNKYFKQFDYGIFANDLDEKPVLESVGFTKTSVVEQKEEIPVLSREEYVSLREAKERLHAASNSEYISHEEMLRQSTGASHTSSLSHEEMLNSFDEPFVDTRLPRRGRNPIVYREATEQEYAQHAERLPDDFNYIEHIKSRAKVVSRPKKDEMMEELKEIVYDAKYGNHASLSWEHRKALKSIKTGKQRYVPVKNHHRGQSSAPVKNTTTTATTNNGACHVNNGIQTTIIPLDNPPKPASTFEELMAEVDKQFEEDTAEVVTRLVRGTKYNQSVSLERFPGSTAVDCGKGKLYVAEYNETFDHVGTYRQVYERMMINTIERDFKAANYSFTTSTALAGMSDVFKGVSIDAKALESIKDNRKFIETVFQGAEKILVSKLNARVLSQIGDPGVELENTMINAMETDTFTVEVDGIVQTYDQNYTGIQNIKESLRMLRVSWSYYKQYQDNDLFIAEFRKHISGIVKELSKGTDWRFSVSTYFLYPAAALSAVALNRAATANAALKGAAIGAGLGEWLGNLIPYI